MGSSKEFFKQTKCSKLWILRSDKSGLLNTVLFAAMVGQKKRSVYRKQRKGKAFTGKQKHEKTPSVSGENQPSMSQENSTDGSSETPRVSASRRKLNLQECVETPDDVVDFDRKGYRFIDIAKFSDSLSEAHVCDNGKY